MIEIRLSALKESKPHEYLLRFLFGGLCTVVAGMVARKFGPAIGGLFLAFPAIFPAGASLIESTNERRSGRLARMAPGVGRMAAGNDAAGAALGCVGLAFVTAPLLWEVRKQRFFARSQSRRDSSVHP